MTTIRTANTGRVTITEAKRLILEGSQRELFVQVYKAKDGTLKAVVDAEPKSIFASHLNTDFAENCGLLGIVPRWKYRPGKTGYTGDPATDDLYTISRDELASLADLYGLTPEGAETVTTVEAGRTSTRSKATYLAEEADKAERHAEGHFTMCEVAELFAAAHGINAEDFLNSRMHPGFLSGALVLLDPKDGGPVTGRRCRDFHDWVTPANMNVFLEREGFPYRWPAAPLQATDMAGPAAGAGDGGAMGRHIAQERALLSHLDAAGLNPKALPRRKAGKPGVKAAARKALQGTRLFVGEKIFDKAWERLRASGEINEGP